MRRFWLGHGLPLGFWGGVSLPLSAQSPRPARAEPGLIMVIAGTGGRVRIEAAADSGFEPAPTGQVAPKETPVLLRSTRSRPCFPSFIACWAARRTSRSITRETRAVKVVTVATPPRSARVHSARASNLRIESLPEFRAG
jgi:hypothetical protein